MNPSLSNILAGLTGYLEHLREEGVRTVEVSPDVMEALQAAPRASAGVTAPAASAPRPAPAEPPPSPSHPLQLELIAEQVRACTKCELHGSRCRAVPGQGTQRPDILFVGEAPGFDEDQQGLAFVGRAGQLLTKMIHAMGYTREEVFIANILKCRPPGNRTPLPDEMRRCLPYLEAQIELLRPKVIVALGAVALKGLLGTTQGITRLRGKWLTFKDIRMMPTFHPAYLLRNPAAKRDAWDDLKEVLRHLGRPIPEVKKKG